jgi:hypothetical protein
LRISKLREFDNVEDAALEQFMSDPANGSSMELHEFLGVLALPLPAWSRKGKALKRTLR